MNKTALICRAKVKKHKDGSFSVVARDITTHEPVYIKHHIPPFNRRKAIWEATNYNKRMFGSLRRELS